MIATALCCGPRILIADEPTTALDVTTQAQILALLRELQAREGMAIVLITHNLGVVAELCDEVVVMYLGRVVERGPVDAIFHAPQHPYTRALLRSIPSVHAPVRTKLPAIAGSLPHPYRRPPGCPFHPRCPRDDAAGCASAHEPELTALAGEDQAVGCFLHHPVQPRRERRATPLARGARPAEGVSDPARASPPPRGRGPGGGRRELPHRPRRDAVAGRRERLREDDDGALHPARDRADRGPDHLPARRRHVGGRRRLCPRGAAAAPARDADGLPGSVLVAEPAQDAARDRRRAAARQRRGHAARSASSGWPSCCGWSASAPSSCAASRTPSAAASASASASRARWRCNPSLVVADEPVSALDVSVQAQILNLLVDLQAELGLTYLFVAHDLSVVKHVSDRVAVMYVGPHRRAGADRAPVHARRRIRTPRRCWPRCRSPTRACARGASSWRARSPTRRTRRRAARSTRAVRYADRPVPRARRRGSRRPPPASS